MAQEKVEAGGHASRVTQEQRWVLGLASAASFIVILDVMVVTTALTAIRETRTDGRCLRNSQVMLRSNPGAVDGQVPDIRQRPCGNGVFARSSDDA